MNLEATLRFLRLLVVALFLFYIFSLTALAQYTDRAAMDHLGGPQEFARRRAELAKQLKSGYTLLFARINEPEAVGYREDNDFYYFTGLQDQAAVLLINNENGETTVFEPAQHPRVKQVYGPNLLSLTPAEQKELGYPRVFPDNVLDRALARIYGGSTPPDLWVRLGFADKADGARPETASDYAEQYAAPYGDPTPGDRSALKKLGERYPRVELRDLTPTIDGMRNIKTPAEIEVL